MSDYNNKKRNDAFWDYHKQREALNEQFLKPTIFTAENESLTTDSRFELGKEYVCGPKIPNNAKDAFKLFVDYYAHFNFYTQVNLFFDTYLSFESKAAIKEEIAEIEAFITEANKVRYKDASKDHFTIDDYFEYKRFSEGYYNDSLMDEAKFNESSRAASVYGKYILFYAHLKNKLNDMISQKSKLIDISCDYSLDYFTNESNIPNQDLVNETIAYFENGPGSRTFKPLEFLNLFEKQYRFVIKNWGDDNIVIAQLKSLPLTELEKHILYGIILKWFGGYPIYSRMETDVNVFNSKKAIEREFLNYHEATPEKEFCKADRVRRTVSEMMTEALNDLLKYGTPVEKTLEVLGYYKIIKKTYRSFDELFADGYKDGLVEGIESKEQFLLIQTKKRFAFKLWLESHKGWIDRDEDQYDTFLTMETLIEFFEFQKSGANSVTKGNQELPYQDPINGFNSIFLSSDWRKYISAFEKTVPPLLSNDWTFIGNRKKHIGVICGWIYELKSKGIIRQTSSRSKLASILNTELKEFNMGADGKTFDNTSREYTNGFKSQLLDITK
jgi:hypothetical protein